MPNRCADCGVSEARCWSINKLKDGGFVFGACLRETPEWRSRIDSSREGGGAE